MLLLWICSNIQTTFTTSHWGHLTSRTTNIGRCVNLSIAYIKYLRFYPLLVKQCYCTTQRPPFVSILSCSHVLGTTTIRGALLSIFMRNFFCVAHFLHCTFYASTFRYFWDSVTSSRRFFSRKMLGLLQIFCYFWDLQNQVSWHLSFIAYSPIHNFVYKSRI